MKTAFIAHGKGTFANKDSIKNLGFSWLSEDKAWVRIISHDLSTEEVEDLKNQVTSLNGVFLIISLADPFIGTVADPSADKKTARKGSGYDWKAELQKQANNAPIENPAPAVGSVVEIEKWQANSMQKNLKMDFFWRNLVIEEVLEDKQKSFLAKVSFSSTIANRCHVCGRTLDCEISKACGVGPVCCKNIGFERPGSIGAEVLLAKIEKFAKDIGTVGPVWISKRAIKSVTPPTGVSVADAGELEKEDRKDALAEANDYDEPAQFPADDLDLESAQEEGLSADDLKWALGILGDIAESERQKMPGANANAVIKSALDRLANFVAPKGEV